MRNVKIPGQIKRRKTLDESQNEEKQIESLQKEI